MTEEPKKAKLQPVQVRLLTSSTEAALVEFEHKGRLSRATVRAADVENGCVDATALEAGIPYGLPWEEIKFAAPKPDQIADALRRAGIWTREDLHRNPKAAIGIASDLRLASWNPGGIRRSAGFVRQGELT